MRESQVGRFVFLVAPLLAILSGCDSKRTVAPSTDKGSVPRTEKAATSSQEKLTELVKSAPSKIMSRPGLAGALGGARVKLLKGGDHEILLPVPQLADGQVPLCFFISSTPPEAMIEHRLQKREDANVVVSIKLKGEANQEVQFDWCSVILVSNKKASPSTTTPKQYVSATACVQSEAKEITKLTKELWPMSDKVTAYAANVQQFVRKMKQVKRPLRLDALGILDSGANGICTANANLALALLRSKGIPCRSMAVIPPVSQQLEMHRVVEYFHEGRWHSFDPSSLHADVPMKPWQHVIMAKTTIADETAAMKPRMAAMIGCPYGQELELVTSGITLWGRDFFWTIAKPIAEFEVADEAVALATNAWQQTLKEGKLSEAQLKAAVAKNAKELLAALQAK